MKTTQGGVVKNSIEASLESKDYTPSPCRKTTAQPGTPRKIAILIARIEAGRELWNEDDPTNMIPATEIIEHRADRMIQHDPDEDFGDTSIL
jgi:hypothetical protein